LLRRHRRRAAVGEEVNDDVLGRDLKDVERRLARFLSRCSRVVSMIGSTILILNGSMIVFMFSPDCRLRRLLRHKQWIASS
jgi:hypothetical protein